MADLKSMSGKEKREYIWDYYKLHILGGAFVLFFIVSFVYGQITKIDYVANLTIVAGVGYDSKVPELEKQITELVVKDGDKKKSAAVDVIPIENQETPDAQLLQKFTVKMAAKEIDVAVLDKVMFNNIVKQEGCMQLDTMSEIDLTAVKGEKVEGTTDNGTKGVFAISAKGNSILESLGVNTESKVIAIMNTTTRKDTAIEIFKWLTK